ncbi:MAG: sugar ABC transporter permease, partial [Enterococcus aquimarinus]
MQKKMKSMKSQTRMKMTFSYLLLILMVIVIVYPLLWTIGASFNPGNSLVSTSLIPANPTLSHYRRLFANEGSLFYSQWYWNSLKISF